MNKVKVRRKTTLTKTQKKELLKKLNLEMTLWMVLIYVENGMDKGKAVKRVLDQTVKIVENKC